MDTQLSSNDVLKAAVIAKGVSVAFRETLGLAKTDVTCLRERVNVITGPNGSGKTTFLNALCGIVRRTTGDVRLFGETLPMSWTPQKAYNAGIRRTFQVPRHWGSLDLVENLVLTRASRSAPVREYLEKWLPGIEPSRSPVQLSFGQRRLLELLRVRTSLCGARLALLDEPLAGLDERSRAKAIELVVELMAASCTVIVVDHHPERWVASNATVLTIG